tara:strand:- start:4994 stop:5833 length:840 start_codon:yes stop_codon:yes gene_type:complete
MKNEDETQTIKSFGDEWKKFDQDNLNKKYLEFDFNRYFKVFPWNLIDIKSEGYDMGCGTGRWAKFVSPKVKKLNCIEPSDAIQVAKKKLKDLDNIGFYKEKILSCSLKNNSQDFGYILGVLHHLPNPLIGLKKCVDLLKPGAPILIYFYYSFENRPFYFRIIWMISNFFRKLICRLPSFIKNLICEIISFLVYLPLVKFSKLTEILNLNFSNIPLYEYRNKPLYTLRTDARDRFGTIIEHRMSKKEISSMMQKCNLTNIVFCDDAPYWCVSAIKIKNEE